MELDRLSARDRGVDFLHAIDLLQFALRLRSFARLGAKSIGKQLQGRDLSLLIFVGGELLHFARCFLLDVTVPIAPIPNESAMRDLDDRTDELIQKFAIVRDHQDRARIISQIFLEPYERFEIEMIGRLVEQKKSGSCTSSRAKCARMIQPPLIAFTGRSKSDSRKASPARIRFAFGSSCQPPCSSKRCNASWCSAESASG